MTQNFEMLTQQIGRSHQSPFKLMIVLVFHLLQLQFCTGRSQLIGSTQPITATIGDNVILPCHLEPAGDVAAKTLEWKRFDLESMFVYVQRAGQDLVQAKHPSYRGRTSLFTDELKKGNMSLKLSKVKPSDAGSYRCYIPDMNADAVVKLVVGAVSSPVIVLEGMTLQCESSGWYPEPEVLWLNGEGNLLSAGPTETVRGPDDLYTVSSRVTVEKRHSNSFTCRVQQKDTNHTREAHIRILDGFFKVQSSSATIGLAVCLVVCILIILSLIIFMFKENIIKTMRSCRDETDNKEKKNQTNSSEDQPVTEERETEQLMTEPTVKTRVLNNEENQKIKHQTSSPDSQDHSCVVEEVDPDGKFVRLRTRPGKIQLLTNCKLNIEVNESTNSYKFPAGFMLQDGVAVTIWASDGGGNHNPPTELVWKEQKSWGAADKVTLTSAMGEVLATKTIGDP